MSPQEDVLFTSQGRLSVAELTEHDVAGEKLLDKI